MLFKKKLEIVQKYLEKNSKKGFIKKFQLFIRYLINFITKKN